MLSGSPGFSEGSHLRMATQEQRDWSFSKWRRYSCNQGSIWALSWLTRLYGLAPAWQVVVEVYSRERVRPAAGGKILPKDLVLTFFPFPRHLRKCEDSLGSVKSFGESAQPLQSVKLSILSRVHGYGQFLATNRGCEWRLPSCKLPLIKICWVNKGRNRRWLSTHCL